VIIWIGNTVQRYLMSWMFRIFLSSVNYLGGTKPFHAPLHFMVSTCVDDKTFMLVFNFLCVNFLNFLYLVFLWMKFLLYTSISEYFESHLIPSVMKPARGWYLEIYLKEGLSGSRTFLIALHSDRPKARRNGKDISFSSRFRNIRSIAFALGIFWSIKSP